MNLRLGEEAGERRRGRDVVGALLDEAAVHPALALGAKPQQVVEEVAAGLLEVVAVRGLEARDRGVEAIALDESVHAAKAARLKALPPEAAQALDELRRA